MSATCDRHTAKHGGWWRCGRVAAVRSVREQVGFPGRHHIVHYCRRHQHHAREHASWVEIIAIVKIFPLRQPSTGGSPHDHGR
jgi:hypothetical protein